MKKQKKSSGIMEYNEEAAKISSAKAVGKQIKYGAIATVSIIIFIAAAIIINVVANIASSRFNLKADFTKDQLFMLGDQTKSFLSEMKEKGNKAEIIVIGDEQTYKETATASGAVSSYRYIYETVNNYHNENEDITIKYIDPRYNPGFFTSRKITLSETSEEAGTPVVVVYSPDTGRYREIKDKVFENLQYVGLERRITGALAYITTEKLQKIGLTTANGETIAAEYSILMEDNGYQAVPVKLSEIDEIPDDITILIINNPQRQFSAEDIKKINKFLDNGELLGKHLMVFGDIDMPYNKLLEAYLSNEWGLNFGDQHVLDNSKNIKTIEDNKLYPYLKLEYAETDISGELSKNKFNPYVRLGKTRDVSRGYDSLDNIKTFPLIKSSDTSFGKPVEGTNLTEADLGSLEKSETDTSGPFEVMAASQKTRFDGTDQYNSTVIISGSTSFVDDYILANLFGFTETTSDYMVNLTKYLSATTQSVDTDILPKSLMGDVLMFSEDSQLVATVLCLSIGLPMIFVIVGIVVYRRRKYL